MVAYEGGGGHDGNSAHMRAYLVHVLKEAHRLVVWWRLGERGVDVVHVQRTLRVTNCQAPPVARPANTTDDNQ